MEKRAVQAKNIDKSANNKILSSILINVEDIQNKEEKSSVTFNKTENCIDVLSIAFTYEYDFTLYLAYRIIRFCERQFDIDNFYGDEFSIDSEREIVHEKFAPLPEKYRNYTLISNGI